MKYIRQFSIFVLLMILLSLVIPISTVRAESEPNDTPSLANPLTLGVVGDQNATIATTSDQDWYRVNLSQDRWYIFETYNISTNLSTLLRLYAPDGSSLLAYDYSSGTGNTYSRIAFSAPYNGDFYLQVSGTYGAGPYSIRGLLKYDEGGSWDSVHEPNDTWQNAFPILEGFQNSITSTIYVRGPYSTVNDDRDLFYFSAVQNNWYVVETFNVAKSLDTTLAIYSIDGTSQLTYDYNSGTGNTDARITWKAPQTGKFYIQVTSGYNQEGLYSVRVLPKYDEGGSWDANGEDNDAWTLSSALNFSQTYNRSLYSPGNYIIHNYDQDYYWFAVKRGYSYSFSLPYVSSSLVADLRLFGIDGVTQLAASEDYVNPGTPRSISRTFYTSGIYYLRVDSNSSWDYKTGTYQIRATTSGAPTLFVSEKELSFVASNGGTNPFPSSFIIANAGSGNFTWNASSDQTWLSLSANSGSASAPVIVNVIPNIFGLAPGDFSANITISSEELPEIVQVVKVFLHIDPAIVYTDETESNDTSGVANPILNGWTTPIKARISATNDNDWYRFNGVTGHYYDIEVYNVARGLQTLLLLYDTNGSTLLAYDYSSGTGNTYSRIRWQAQSSGNFFIKVSSTNGVGSYSIRVLPKYGEGAIWDGFHEPNDNWETSYHIDIGFEHAIQTTIYPRGTFSLVSDDVDVFQFNTELGHRYVIETFNVSPDLDTTLELIGPNGTPQITYDYNSGTGDSDARILWQAPQAGEYFIRVTSGWNQVGSYSLRVLPKYDEGAAWDSSWEPDDVWITASPVILNQTQSRNFYEHGNYTVHDTDRDMLWFYAQAGYQYVVNLINVVPTLRANVYIISLDGTSILASEENYTEPGTSKSVGYTFSTPGRYYVLIRPQSYYDENYGDYQVRVTSVVPAIQVNTETITLNGKLGNTSTPHQILTITNSGSGSFTWSITLDQSWLNVNPTSGNIPPDSPVNVWANITGLAEGTYYGSISINAAGIENSPYTIPVTLKISRSYEVYVPFIKR